MGSEKSTRVVREEKDPHVRLSLDVERGNAEFSSDRVIVENSLWAIIWSKFRWLESWYDSIFQFSWRRKIQFRPGRSLGMTGLLCGCPARVIQNFWPVLRKRFPQSPTELLLYHSFVPFTPHSVRHHRRTCVIIELLQRPLRYSFLFHELTCISGGTSCMNVMKCFIIEFATDSIR